MQLEEGYRQALWLPARGRLQPQAALGGVAARLELNSHVERGLYALYASGQSPWRLDVAGCRSHFSIACLLGWRPGDASASPLHRHCTACTVLPAEGEVWLCQETGWSWLRKIGASATAGEQRMRLRRGYVEPQSKVGSGLQCSVHSA